MRKERMTLKVADLHPNNGQLPWLPKNPRQWTQTDIDRTAKSIQEDPDFLEDRPLLVATLGVKKGWLVFAGNLRLTAAKKIGLEEIPCVAYARENEEDEMTIKRRAMKDNGSFGSWDFDSLANEWDDLPLADFGIPSWETPEPEKETTEAKDDDFDENEQEIPARCKLGDIWQLGDHRLMCGDSTDLETVKSLMGGTTADLLLTDPPYNVDYEGGTEDKMKIQNDSFKAEGEFLEFLRKAMRCASEVMKAGASYYIFHADSEGRNFREAATEIGKVRECLIWVKNSLVLGRQDYQWRHEPCLYGWKDGAGHNWFNDRSQTTVLEFDRPKRNAEHPTMKPIPLFSYLMKNSTKPGDIVLDLFAGSGTTLICAEQLGRRCFTMELDPHYCDVVLTRWEALTGQSAVKL